MMAQDGFNPHLGSPETSSIEALAKQALRQYGDSATSAVEGETMLMMIEFGNRVVDEIRMHPYADESDHALNYYTSQYDRTHIPDNIMKAGLLAFYAEQQGSNRAEVYLGTFYRTMNMEMYRRFSGGSNQPLSMHTYDSPLKHNKKTGAIVE